MALNNFKFFDINYNGFGSITGTNLATATAFYGYDNRSDAGYVDWDDSTGSFIVDWGSGTYNLKDFLVLNHNWLAGHIAVYTGTAWDTITTFAAQSASTYYYSHASTITGVEQVEYSFSGTQDGENGQAGELIATREKFSLDCNPDALYQPTLIPVGEAITLYNGKDAYSTRGDDVFRAMIAWEFLEGNSTDMTDTDLENVTELARKHAAFLFWPNADNTQALPYTWRRQDIYKCRIYSPSSYEFSHNALDNYIAPDYVIQEVQ